MFRLSSRNGGHKPGCYRASQIIGIVMTNNLAAHPNILVIVRPYTSSGSRRRSSSETSAA
jgi:hypothetical protein